jgi:hypothetical protein
VELVLVPLLQNLVLTYDLSVFALFELDLEAVHVFLVKNETVSVLSLNWLAWEEVLDARKDIVQRLFLHIFPDVEKNIGEVFLDLVFLDRSSCGIIVFVPAVVLEILDDAYVMPEVQISIVVYHSI